MCKHYKRWDLQVEHHTGERSYSPPASASGYYFTVPEPGGHLGLREVQISSVCPHLPRFGPFFLSVAVV